jgi:hypothetical protein
MAMANKISGWFKSLSSVGKIVVVGAGLLLTSGVAMAVTSPPAKETPVKPTAVVEVKQETTTVAIPYESQEIQDGSLASGTRVVVTEGVNGEKTITQDVEYTDGKETKRTTLPEQTTKPSIAKVTKVGTYVAPAPPAPKCDTNYSGGCVPIVSYDLDCPDIGFRVYVVGNDKHGFDGRDNDGIGCESY